MKRARIGDISNNSGYWVHEKGRLDRRIGEHEPNFVGPYGAEKRRAD